MSKVFKAHPVFSKHTSNKINGVLIKACREGNVNLIKKSIKQYGNNIPRHVKRIILETAVRYSQVNIVRLLLEEYKFDPNMRNSCGILILALFAFRYYRSKETNEHYWIPRRIELGPKNFEILNIFIQCHVDINTPVWSNGPPILLLELILINGQHNHIKRANDNEHLRCDKMITTLLENNASILSVFYDLSLLNNINNVISVYLQRDGNIEDKDSNSLEVILARISI